MTTKADILNLIDDEDVEFIRLQFADAFGNLKNMAITPGQLERSLANQYSIDGEVMFDNLIDSDETLYLKPDLETFVILPWRPQRGKVGKILCDVCNADGTLYECSPRTILKKVLDKAAARGYRFMINPECEFFLFHTDENDNPTTVSHEKAGYLDVGPSDFGENARRDMVLTLEEMGFEVECSHHETAVAQHKIVFTDGEALKTADALMNFKFAVRSIAKRFGLYATFMPKPRTDAEGSSMHLNISMYRDGKNLFDPGETGSVTEEASRFIAGILAHAEGMCAVTNPVVNSYKRILEGYGAPSAIAWSAKRGKNILKLRNNFDETKIEVKFPDPSANPYLAIAVCIAAGMDGIERGLEPANDNAQSGRHLPGNLKDAIRMMKKDKFICETLGDEFSRTYISIKSDEWNEYMMQVSDWEIERYLGKM